MVHEGTRRTAAEGWVRFSPGLAEQLGHPPEPDLTSALPPRVIARLPAAWVKRTVARLERVWLIDLA